MTAVNIDFRDVSFANQSFAEGRRSSNLADVKSAARPISDLACGPPAVLTSWKFPLGELSRYTMQFPSLRKALREKPIIWCQIFVYKGLAKLHLSVCLHELWVAFVGRKARLGRTNGYSSAYAHSLHCLQEHLKHKFATSACNNNIFKVTI